jgi:hypothetical protein
VSTFRLEPEHFILTTGTFNLIVKDRIAFRLSGALSVRTDPLRESVRPRTFQPYRVARTAVNPLQSQDFHLFCTAGSVNPGEKNSKRGELFNDNATTLFRLQWQGLFGACRSGRRSNLKKIAGRFCFSRNPSGTLFPNANPETRGQLEAFCIRCQSP